VSEQLKLKAPKLMASLLQKGSSSEQNFTKKPETSKPLVSPRTPAGSSAQN